MPKTIERMLIRFDNRSVNFPKWFRVLVFILVVIPGLVVFLVGVFCALNVIFEWIPDL